MKEIYLDNSATTQVFPEIAELMTKIMVEDYGNPSSMHIKGINAEKYIKEARKTIADIMKVAEKEILFTSCGTESDNMALRGCAYANKRKGMHLITTQIEHPAILRTMEELKKEGFEITYLGVDDTGVISLKELEAAIRPDTILVSIMHVNNEIGSVQPVSEAGALIKKINPNTLFHVDAVQSFGKFRIYPKRMNIDLLSVSGHKIHGPKGIGFLYINEKVKINPIIFGGGQQGGMRSGTESVPLIAAIGKASSMMYENLEEDVKRLYLLKKRLIDSLTEIEGVSVNGIPKDNSLGAPHVISVSVENVRAEVLLHSLEEKGIYVSAGSACSTHKRTASDTLTAINLPKNLLDSTVRFSLSVLNTQEDIDQTVEAMKEIIIKLRKYVRK